MHVFLSTLFHFFLFHLEHPIYIQHNLQLFGCNNTMLYRYVEILAYSLIFIHSSFMHDGKRPESLS